MCAFAYLYVRNFIIFVLEHMYICMCVYVYILKTGIISYVCICTVVFVYRGVFEYVSVCLNGFCMCMFVCLYLRVSMCLCV